MSYGKGSLLRGHRVAVLLLVYLLLVVPLFSGCGVKFRVKRLDPATRFREFRVSALTDNRPHQKTEQLLRLLFLDEQYQNDPEGVLGKLAEKFKISPSAALALAISELAYIEGRKWEKRNTSLAAAYYVMSAVHTMKYHFAEPDVYFHSVFSPYLRFAADLYNSSVSRFVVLWQLEGRPWTEPWELNVLGIAFSVSVLSSGESLWDPDYFDQLEPAYELKAKGLKNEYYLPGVGAPLIGVRKNEPGKEEFESRRPRPIIAMPVTAVLRMNSKGAGDIDVDRDLVLHFFDPLRQTTLELEKFTLPLEADLSTTFGMFLSNTRPGSEDFSRLKRPDLFMDKIGITMLDPYDPDKIPVLMIHGLYSSPATFIQMFNDLTGAKKIRENYQFWFFEYPTGLPISYSSYRLRQELDAIRSELDPKGNNPNMNNMVVVGHSMGGVLSRSLIQSSGSQLWDTIFSKPIEELDLTEKDRELVSSIIFFEGRPYIGRAVFIAAPFRGSEVARTFIGKMGKRLISLPGVLTQDRSEILERNKDALKIKTGDFLQAAPTSVDQLSPDSPILLALADLPVAKNIPYHTIIGIRKNEEGPGSSDGLVAYESSHLDGAASEKLVPEWHSCLEHPLTIAEVARILLVHLEESRQAMLFPEPVRVGELVTDR